MKKDGDLADAAREGYAPLAEIYHRSRPGYPDAIIDLLTARIGLQPDDPVVDIGAGTGNFTRLLAARNFRVTAIEPVMAMQQCAPRLSNVTWSQGTFEAMSLPTGSQRWAVAAQSFHWADANRALPEIRRVLSPHGWFTTLWNTEYIDRSPLLRWTYALLRREVPAYHYDDRTSLFRRLSSHLVGSCPYRIQRIIGRALASLRNPNRPLNRGLLLQSTGDFTRFCYDEVLHSIPFDRQGYMDLWRSRNRLRSIAGDDAFDHFLLRLAEHLDDQSIDNIEVPYICGAWSSRVVDR